ADADVRRRASRPRGLAARDATPPAFERRCIPSGCVAPSSNIPHMLGRRALPAGRLAVLGATAELHHGLLAVRIAVVGAGGQLGAAVAHEWRTASPAHEIVAFTRRDLDVADDEA